MRVAALYDVQGNMPALTAVLAETDALGVGAIVVGGDVSSGPMPVETLDALRVRGARFVRGNADRVLDLRCAKRRRTRTCSSTASSTASESSTPAVLARPTRPSRAPT